MMMMKMMKKKMMMMIWIFFLSMKIADMRVGFHPANTDHSQDMFSSSLTY